MKKLHYRDATQEVTTEDGKVNYWRYAVPLPYYTHRFFFKSAFGCECGKKFKSEAEYELHYRKALDEEERFDDPF